MEKPAEERIDPAYYKIRHEGTMPSVYFKSPPKKVFEPDKDRRLVIFEPQEKN